MEAYTDTQIDEYLVLAQEIGIGKAIRELGYPKSWATGQKWAKLRGVKVSLDDLMANVKKYHTFYETEDMLAVIEEGIERAREKFVEESLDADSLKKVAEAVQKLSNTWLLLQGKATGIKENRETDQMDAGLADLLMKERIKNNKTSAIELVSSPKQLDA